MHKYDDFPDGTDIAEYAKQELARLRALARYDIMDSAPEADYDAITQLVCELMGAHYTMVSFIGADHLWVKSAHGIDIERAPREQTVCNIVLSDSDELLEIEDLARDARACYLELDRQIVSYVGIPLRAQTGERIGVLSMGFAYTKRLDDKERRTLNTLRRQVEVMLERRRAMNMVGYQQRALIRLAEQHDKLLNTVSHDTRNLLAGVLSNCEFAITQIDEHTDEAREAIEDALSAAQQAKHMLNHIDDSKRRFRQDTPLKLPAIHEAF